MIEFLTFVGQIFPFMTPKKHNIDYFFNILWWFEILRLLSTKTLTFKNQCKWKQEMLYLAPNLVSVQESMEQAFL